MFIVYRKPQNFNYTLLTFKAAHLKGCFDGLIILHFFRLCLESIRILECISGIRSFPETTTATLAKCQKILNSN